MCGISGIWSINKKLFASKHIKIMTDAIKHRGPDGEGFWSDENIGISLGHRRLSIIDLSHAADQPMIDENYVIVFNGEIYNYIEVKEKLTLYGYKFKTESDTEVILKAYHKWGKDCIKYFDGMFVIVLWDKKAETLFIARDRFGEKPFYYSFHDGIFSFSSEMKSLWAIGVPKSINEYNMYLFLNYGIHDNPKNKTETFFKEIKSLKPAHYIILNKNNFNSINQIRYWDIDKTNINIEISFEDAIQKFRELFFVSIQRRLRSDVPVGSSLSGGLDSSAVVTAIKNVSLGNVVQKCFSARFSDLKYDEGYFMKKIIEDSKFEHFETYPSANKLIDDFQKIMYHQEEPFISASVFNQWEVYKLAKVHNVTVLLDGQGADEYLAGYTSLFLPFFRETLVSKGKKELYHQYDLYKKNNIANKYHNLSNRFLFETYFYKFINPLKQIKNNVLGDGISEIINKEFYNSYKKTKSPFNIDVSLKDVLYSSTTISGLDKLLRFADRNSMAFSTEVRLPFLYHELVEFIFSLPIDYLIHEGWTKAPIRYGLADILPEEITWRKNKLGYQAPQNTWMEEPYFKDFGMDYQKIAIKEKYIKETDKLTWEGMVTGVFIEMCNN